jgi:hypothetical protein
MRNLLGNHLSEPMSTPFSPLFRRLIFGICAVLILSIAVAIGMTIVAIRTALIAEANLQAFFHAYRSTLAYVEKNDGQWPGSWSDLRTIRPETDFEWVAKHVKFDFAADPKTIALQTPATFTAIVPEQPCFVYDHHVQVLIDTLKKYHATERIE